MVKRDQRNNEKKQEYLENKKRLNALNTQVNLLITTLSKTYPNVGNIEAEIIELKSPVEIYRMIMRMMQYNSMKMLVFTNAKRRCSN